MYTVPNNFFLSISLPSLHFKTSIETQTEQGRDGGLLVYRKGNVLNGCTTDFIKRLVLVSVIPFSITIRRKNELLNNKQLVKYDLHSNL